MKVIRLIFLVENQTLLIRQTLYEESNRGHRNLLVVTTA